MAVTITKAPLSQEELGVILLTRAFSETRGRSLNRFINSTLLSLCNRGIVDMSSGRAELTEKAQPILECIEPESNQQHDFNKLAQQMRELFPSGNKPDTLKPWRSSTMNVMQRLQTLCDHGYEFSDEEALEATKAYVQASSGNQYMRTLPYFIYKYQEDDSGRRVLNSDLFTWIEQVRDGADDIKPETELSNFY